MENVQALGRPSRSRSLISKFTSEAFSKSHPFYTGKHKIMDTGGRVDKFKKRYGGK